MIARLSTVVLIAAEQTAASQGCDLFAAAALDKRRILVLLASDHDYRVTSYLEGSEEFGPGLYFADEAEACRAFGDRLAELGAS